MATMLWVSAKAATMADINMPYGVTPVSQDIYRLHMAAFYVCCGIGLVVFSVLFFSLFKYRKSKGAKASLFHEHLGVEIIWTIIPTVILIALAIPATIVLKKIHNTDESKLTIKVVGYQWRWRYEYLDQGISFFSNLATPQAQIDNTSPKNPWYLLEVDNPVVVPVNTKIKLLVTSDDVIHAWWVPTLGVKQDGIPGFLNENWFYATEIGTYRGQCGELCGVNHAFMPIVVKVVSKEDFDKWVKAYQTGAKNHTATLGHEDEPKVTEPATQAAKIAEVVALGKAAYQKNCAMCHQDGGEGIKGTFPTLVGSTKLLDERTAITTVLNGVPGTAMQAYASVLDDKTVAAVLTYTRQAWGNGALLKAQNKLPLVQSETITQAKQA